jgi:hypothetical protein
MAIGGKIYLSAINPAPPYTSVGNIKPESHLNELWPLI